MNPIIWNILLALAWTAITGTFTPGNFALGIGVGGVALVVTQRVPGVPHYSRRTWSILSLLGYTAWEIVLANLRVSREILSVEQPRPALLSIPIRVQTDMEVTLLVALLMLTPGTTVVDISPDERHMLVYFTKLPRGGPEQARRGVQEGFERRILEALR